MCGKIFSHATTVQYINSYSTDIQQCKYKRTVAMSSEYSTKFSIDSEFTIFVVKYTVTLQQLQYK